MEVVTFESKAYQDLIQKIENIADYVSKNKLDSTPKTEVWLNSNEVADLLKISIRTLQRLRNDNMIVIPCCRADASTNSPTLKNHFRNV